MISVRQPEKETKIKPLVEMTPKVMHLANIVFPTMLALSRHTTNFASLLYFHT